MCINVCSIYVILLALLQLLVMLIFRELTGHNGLLSMMIFIHVVNFGLHQFVSEPTLGDNILDVVLNNDPYIVNSLYLSAPFSNSDHSIISMIRFSLILSAHESAKDEKYVYDFQYPSAKHRLTL